MITPSLRLLLPLALGLSLAPTSHAADDAKPAIVTGAVMKPVVREIAPPPKPVFNVRDYGAKGDGSAADTLAIRKAIDACAGTGGSVLLDHGDFVSAPLTLRSGMTLYVSTGARLLGSTSPADYPVNDPADAAGGPFLFTVRRSLLSAFDVENLTIDGGGEIDGRGLELLKKGMKGSEPNRPSILRVLRGKSVAVRNVTLRNSLMWTQVYDRCEGLVLEKISAISPPFYGNLDGVDICNCRHVVIRDSLFDAEDDGICLKSHGSAGIDDVLIENNMIMSHCNGIKMGTASVGDVKHVRMVNNTVVRAGISGLAIESVDGSNITGMRITGLTLMNCAQPVFIRLGHREKFWEMDPKDKDRTGKPGSIDDLLVENLRIFATSSKSLGSSITGIGTRNLGSVTLRNVLVEMPGGRAKAPASPKEKDGVYPESTQFGLLPAYAFYVRHADDVRFENVSCGYLADDVRSWLVSDHAKVTTTGCSDLKRIPATPLPPEAARILAGAALGRGK